VESDFSPPLRRELVQAREGVAIAPVVSVIFVLISLSGMILAVSALRNIRDETS